MNSSRDRDDDRGSRRSRDEDERPRRSSRDEDEPRSRRSRDEDEPRGRGRDRDEEPRRSSRRDEDEDRGSRRGGGSSYNYQSRSADQTKKRASMGSQDFDKLLKSHIKMFKPNDGENRIRILPPTWKEPEHFGYDVYVHYGIGADRASYIDLDKMLGKPDPITEERVRARADGDEEYAKELESKRRTLIYLVDRDHPKEGVQAWLMPWTLDKDINKISEDKDSGAVLEIDHPEEGYDVTFEKNGTGLKTKYEGVAIARRTSPLDPNDKGFLDFAIENPLPDQLEYYDYETIAKAFGAKGSSRDKERDREERGSRDRDEPRGRSRDRDEDERKPSRDRDRDDDRGRRDRDEPEPRGKSRDPEAPSWESVHEMTKSELEDLIDDERLDINPKDAKDLEDLADWVCEEMKLKKSAKRDEGSGRSRVRDDASDAEDEDKLRKMRRGRDEDEAPRRRRGED